MQSVARMRTAVHPGTPLPKRMQAIQVETYDIVSLTVDPGCDLFETVHEKLQTLGAVGGSFALEGGTVEHVHLMTGGPGQDGLPMGFHGPHAIAGPLTVIAGAAGCGVDEAGQRFTHCHAAFRNRDGHLIGGHLIPGETIAGADGIAVSLFSLRRGRFARRFDPETRFDIFHPEPA